MSSKLNITIILIFVFTTSPVWAGLCDNTANIRTLASCIDANEQKDPNNPPGSFTVTYDVENKCEYKVEVQIQTSDDKKVDAVLASGEWTEEVVLDAGVEVTGFYCCSTEASCKIPD